MPAQPPTAPPRRKKNITKSDISEPYDFVHLNHVGIDFNSDDVKRAIRPASSTSPLHSPEENLYEAVNRTETPILSGTPPRYDFPPPAEMAPEYDKPSTAKIPPPRPPKPEVVDYINRPSQHLYMNLNAEQARPSRKKNPPPPPPQGEKPRLEVPEEAAPVAFRKPSTPPPQQEPEEAPKIETALRIDAAPPSVILERPGMLGEMRIGLDDPIPIIKGMSSKYRTPTMLTPREMAVDVPSAMRTPDEPNATPPPLVIAPTVQPAPAPAAQSSNKAQLVKDQAVDVSSPPHPPQLGQGAAPREPRDRSAEKRRAPAPPTESSESSKTISNPIYVPLSAARASPQLKNVITELKVKQGSEEITEIKEEEEEGHEYVALDGLRRSKVVSDPVVSEEIKVEKAPDEQKPVVAVAPQETKTIPEAIKVETTSTKEKTSHRSKERRPKAESAKTVETTVAKEVKEVQKPKEQTEKQPKRTESKKKVVTPPAPLVKQEADVKQPQTKEETKTLAQEAPATPSQPNPVPRPRKTVAVTEETPETKEVQDDGIDTGCSDDENEVIRL